MAIQSIMTSSDICNSFAVSGSQVTQQWYIAHGTILANGVTIYTDTALTQKLAPNKTFGVIYNGLHYTFVTSATSTVTGLTQCTATNNFGFKPIVLSQFSSGVIKGTDLPATKNTIRWGSFQDRTRPTNFDLTFNYMDLPMFSEDLDKSISMAIKKGWTYMSNSDVMAQSFPTANRAAWNPLDYNQIRANLFNITLDGNGNPTSVTPKDRATCYNYGYNGYTNIFYSNPPTYGNVANCTENGHLYTQTVPIQFFQFDNEDGFGGICNIMDAILPFCRGLYDRGKSQNPNFVFHLYGGATRASTGGGGKYSQFYYDGSGDKNQWLIPAVSKALHWEKYTQFASNVLGKLSELTGANGKILLESAPYQSESFPITTTLYNKVNGNYTLDLNGERVFQYKTDIQETIRGEVTVFKNTNRTRLTANNATLHLSEGDTDSTINGINEMKPALYWSVWDLYELFQMNFCMRMAVQRATKNNQDLTNSLYNNTIGLVNTYRLVNEGNDTFGMVEKQLSPFQIFVQKWIGFIFIKNDATWCGYNPRSRCGAYQLKAQGQSFPMGNPNDGLFYPNYMVQMSAIENYSAINDMAYEAYNQHGFFQGNDQLWVFSDFTEFQNGECMVAGLYQNSKLLLFCCEPHRDLGEQMNFLVSNTKNAQTFSMAINTISGINFSADVQVLYFPTDTYTPDQVKVTYTKRKGGQVTKNGRWQTVTGTTTGTCPTPIVAITGTLNYSVGNNLILVGTVTGTYNTLQWYKDNVAISGATGLTYTKNTLAIADSGTYELRATNACGGLTASTGVLAKAITVASVTTGGVDTTNMFRIEIPEIGTTQSIVDIFIKDNNFKTADTSKLLFEFATHSVTGDQTEVSAGHLSMVEYKVFNDSTNELYLYVKQKQGVAWGSAPNSNNHPRKEDYLANGVTISNDCKLYFPIVRLRVEIKNIGLSKIANEMYHPFRDFNTQPIRWINNGWLQVGESNTYYYDANDFIHNSPTNEDMIKLNCNNIYQLAQ